MCTSNVDASSSRLSRVLSLSNYAEGFVAIPFEFMQATAVVFTGIEDRDSNVVTGRVSQEDFPEVSIFIFEHTV